MNRGSPASPAGDRAQVMRRMATALLAAMAVLFLLSTHLAGTMPAWNWPRAFAEAALVGGLADWFAVTALFRHPLGLPIPHTAIIPENKDRIAQTMAGFLRTWFLTPQVVARRLRGLNLAGMLGGFLADPGRMAELRVRQGVAGLLGEVLQSLDSERLGGLVKASLRSQAQRLELAPLLGQLLQAAIADRRHLPVIESLLRWTGHALEANEPLLRELIHARANVLLRWTGLDERVANVLLDGLYKLLAEALVDPGHPLRLKVEEGLQTLADDLSNNPAVQARVEAMKRELLANPAMVAWLDSMWERIREAMLRATRDPDRAMAGGLGQGIAAFGASLRDDARLQFLVNRFARRTLAGLVARYGDAIVTLVSDTVKRWDARTVTDRIESAVGRDLQFIRINGTLVGGVVGLLIHAATMIV